MPTNKPRVGAYISEQLKAKAEIVAESESRSLSNWIAVLIEEAVERAESEGKVKFDD
ncbi:hypothetical protein HRE53_30605 (plasmid) [Acaryochloris sp. 'Moss Beach']|uniref:ribbon-helix-helix domain-containing protein n=1 Tax=Acaryochloris sp. 'Moss Beach' TaxID=2740837 RepID=UPI001F184BA4|nr:hypothetical protein [Acaryochloris sp. 'Moss Beach']UJB72941.1 hypothetical protein HRE53_30605 [Acaryochloris sp. 'Moss Beach']